MYHARCFDWDGVSLTFFPWLCSDACRQLMHKLIFGSSIPQYVVICHLLIGIHSEEYVVSWCHHCGNITECTYTNLEIFGDESKEDSLGSLL
jgi:hypothetical protein